LGATIVSKPENVSPETESHAMDAAPPRSTLPAAKMRCLPSGAQSGWAARLPAPSGMTPPPAPTAVPLAPSSNLRTPFLEATTRVVSGLNVAQELAMLTAGVPIGPNTTGGGTVLTTSTTPTVSPPMSAASLLPLRDSVWQATHLPF